MPTIKPTPKVALVTGGARRIGAEIVRILHENAMNVIIHYATSQKEAEKLCMQLNKIRPNSASILPADLNIEKNWQVFIQNSLKIYNKLDVLVNNASVFYPSSIKDLDFDAFDQMMRINLKAPYFLALAAKKALAKTRGCIINIADIHAKRPMKSYPIYSISKAGLRMLTKALAVELGPSIRVNTVAPGSIIWPEGKNAFNNHEKKRIISTSILKKQGHPQEIAKAVLFLAQEADYITGQEITVDGGRSLFIFN